MTASISEDRKATLLKEIHSSMQLEECTKRQLLSLIGKLSFVCKVIPAGRIFLQRLIDLSTSVSQLHHLIPINLEAKLDLVWWSDFLPNWSGTSVILETRWTFSPAMNLYTDASGKKGCGAFCSGRWLQAHWTPAQLGLPIVWKKLFVIVNAVNFCLRTGCRTRSPTDLQHLCYKAINK